MASASEDETLEEILHELSPELREEVEDFARFLRERETPRDRKKMGFSWAGALRELRDEYSSTELAEESMDWWES